MLYPSIGFAVDDVPQSKQDAIRSIGDRLFRANPSQVKREKKAEGKIDFEDDFSRERYRHTVADHTTFMQGLCRMPFNIFECSAFLDYVKASGLDFASKVPTQKEIQEGLELKEEAYPGYLDRATAHHAELSAGLQAKKKEDKDRKKREKKDEQDKAAEDNAEAEGIEVEEGSQEVKIPVESKKSLAAIWRHHLESWQVTYPILDPAPEVISTELRTTPRPRPGLKQPVSPTLPPTKPHQALQTEEQDFQCPCPLDSLFLNPPVPTPNADEPAPQVVPVYGCDAKSLPPPVVHFYALALRSVYAAFANALESIAGEKGELNAMTDGQEREVQVRDNQKKYPYLVTIESEKAAFRAVFGDWAVRESFGKLLWAERPPTATSPVDGYAEALSMVNTAFRSSFKARDDARSDAILKLDTDAIFIIPTLEAPSFIPDLIRQDVREWLETMITLELQYIHLRATLIPRFVDVMSAFLSKYSNVPTI